MGYLGTNCFSYKQKYFFVHGQLFEMLTGLPLFLQGKNNFMWTILHIIYARNNIIIAIFIIIYKEHYHYLRWVWAYKTGLTQTHFIEYLYTVGVPSELLCIVCVKGINFNFMYDFPNDFFSDSVVLFYFTFYFVE